jgi:hypothetical protein
MRRGWDYRFCWVRDAYFVVRGIEPPGRDADDGRFHPLCDRCRGDRPGRGIEAGLWRSSPVCRWKSRSCRTCPAIAALARCGSATPRPCRPRMTATAMSSWRDADVLRPPAAKCGAASTCSRSWKDWASGDHVRLPARCGLVGVSRPARIHTYSSVMCWAACDRLAKIADALALADRIGHWQQAPQKIRERVLEQAWNAEAQQLRRKPGRHRHRRQPSAAG